MTTNQAQKAKQIKSKLLGHQPANPQGEADTQPSDKAPDQQVMTLSNLALSESKTKVPKNKLHRRLWFQILLLSLPGLPVALIASGMLYGQAPQQAESQGSGDETAADLPQSEAAQLTQENADLKVELASLRQSLDGEPASPAKKASPKSAAVPSTPSTPKPPSAAHRVSRPIPVRRSVPQPQIVYRDRPAPKAQPVVAAKPKPAPQPQPVAQAEPKPAANFSLTQKSAHTPKFNSKFTPPMKVSAARPLNRSLVDRRPTTVSRKPTVKAPPQGILVASLTGDLLQDNQAATASPVATDATEGIYPTPESSLGKGLIAPGTTAKAQLVNPITWIPQSSESIIGQRYLLKLSEDVGTVAKKGSTAIAQVTAAEGDFVSMQVVEINRQAIPEGVALVQYKQSPYLQAQLKGQGEGFGNKLLRAGLNAGIDQLRSSNVGDRASSLVSSFAPSRSGHSSRGGLYHFDKEVEIYFTGGV